MKEAMDILRGRGMRLVDLLSKGRGEKGSVYLIPSDLLSSCDWNTKSFIFPGLLGHDTSDTDAPIKYLSNISNTILISSSFCGNLLCSPGATSLYKELVWIQSPKASRPGLTENQKILFELVLGGVRDVEILANLFGSRKKDLKSRVIKPLLQHGLLQEEGKDHLKVASGYTAKISKLFKESGGREALRATEEKIKKDREEHKAKLAEEGLKVLVGEGIESDR